MRTFPAGVRLVRRDRHDESPLERPILVCSGCRGFTAHNMATEPDTTTGRYACEECGERRAWGH